jgi:hypothetical protein
MALLIITEPSPAETQLRNYNGSWMVQRATYQPGAGLHWAVVGLVLHDAVTANDEAALIAAIEGLAAIVAVADPRVFGQLPAVLEVNAGLAEPTHDITLHSTIRAAYVNGFIANNYSVVDQRHATVQPPLGKKWMVCNCVVAASPISQAEIDAVQASLVALAGITEAKVLSWGTVPLTATGISLAVETRMRIDPIAGGE